MSRILNLNLVVATLWTASLALGCSSDDTETPEDPKPSKPMQEVDAGGTDAGTGNTAPDAGPGGAGANEAGTGSPETDAGGADADAGDPGADAAACDPEASLKVMTEATNGSIDVDPDQASYECGDTITLTAKPVQGATFIGWGGALSGDENPETLILNGDVTVSAEFDLDTSAPEVSGVDVEESAGSAVVSWNTDEPSIGSVEYGLTSAVDLGSVDSETLASMHAVTLPGLKADTVYYYRIVAEDGLGNSADEAVATFTTLPNPDGLAGIRSDDFWAPELAPTVWQIVDPQADSTVTLVGAGTADARLQLSVPEGVAHDAWVPSNTSLRVMQPAENEDFQVQVKFDSMPSMKFQSQGILVEEDASNFLRFDVYHDGTDLRIFAATISGDTMPPSTRVNAVLTAAPTTYLRLGRSGDAWTAEYSADGMDWQTAVNFTHPMNVTAVGPFAGNAAPSPAFDAQVDYFFETSAPVDPED